MRVPAASVPAGDARRDVRSFGAKPNDDLDDSNAIQKALDSLKSGETLYFPSGRYLTSRSITVRRPGITITGDNATLHATNPEDMALMVQADDTTVASLTFTAVTNVRRHATRTARIAVVGDMPGSPPKRIRNAVIRDNRIVNADGPGTPGANSSSASGILVQHAERFLIAGNTVVRSLADGIHITGGSRNGRVLNNNVRETGDDLIAVVSYADKGPAARNSAAKLANAWNDQAEKGLNRNILISGNRVSGQYWGRGITVVGGQSVAILRNTIENVPLGAGILLAREAVYQTFGVDNVVVEGNIVRDVQTGTPPYNVADKFSPGKRTGHGAIEVHAALFDDEAADDKLRGALSVRNVVVRGNTVQNTAVPAFRAGVGFDNTVRDGSASRHSGNGVIENLSVQDNRFDDVKDAIRLLSEPLKDSGLHCSGNQRDGGDYNSPSCKTAEPRLRDFPLHCSPDGQWR
ncbi:MAG: right-handed parallel beta-helix repeat-containing protein [Burkholderiaceae bacterium]|nr:right-handed parallel beta-helix repeat-containing protein [Burkholderiaceae bacterium]